MALSHGEGIVLKIRDFAEADLIITLFTTQWGKRNAIAKGVKRLNSRLGGVFDLLNHVEFVFYEKPRLDLVSQGSVRSAYLKLKSNLDAVTAALRVARLLEKLLPLHQREVEIYTLFVRLLDLLEEDDADSDALCLSAVLKLLSLFGHRPQLKACVHCGRLTENLFFAALRGGVVCQHCASGEGLKVSRGLVRGLDALLHLPLERAAVVRFSREEFAFGQKMIETYGATLIP